MVTLLAVLLNCTPPKTWLKFPNPSMFFDPSSVHVPAEKPAEAGKELLALPNAAVKLDALTFTPTSPSR